MDTINFHPCNKNQKEILNQLNIYEEILVEHNWTADISKHFWITKMGFQPTIRAFGCWKCFKGTNRPRGKNNYLYFFTWC
ncbi:MAG: hypothetical protein ACTSWN_01570 [Promethearchaeota archaeon]